MKPKHQLQITMNCERTGYEKNRQQTLIWLQHIMPALIKTRELPINTIFLQATSQIVSFCLS